MDPAHFLVPVTAPDIDSFPYRDTEQAAEPFAWVDPVPIRIRANPFVSPPVVEAKAKGLGGI